MIWDCQDSAEASVARLAQALGVSRPTALLLCTLGYEEPGAASGFLQPMLRGLDDPFRLTNMDRAVARLLAAIDSDETIAVFGDYDVDGVTSVAFLVDLLRRFGKKARYLVPRRLDEGYGLSLAALGRLIEGGKPDLLIAVDCGTNSHEELHWLREQGVDVLVLDHHQGRVEGDCPAILVNPHVFDPEDAPWRDLCAVGLVFKLAHALLKRLREDGDRRSSALDLKDCLDLVALGTVADLVQLRGENRILARKGLEMLQSPRRPGLCALFEVAGIPKGFPVSPFDLAFRISPRINASGRLADAIEPIELLLSDNAFLCKQTAQLLDGHNKDRQAIEKQIADEAADMVTRLYADAPGFVLHSDDWHPGVVGIVASRITHRFNRPAIVLGSEDSGRLKGSGRGIPGCNMVELLTPCGGLLDSWGGHPMAVGVSLSQERLDAFRSAFEEAVRSHPPSDPSDGMRRLSCWLEPHEVTSTLFDEMDRLGPFGQGNPEPLFGLRRIRLGGAPAAFGNGHIRFNVDLGSGRRYQCIGWGKADEAPPPHTPVDLAVRLTWNVWNNSRSARLQLEGWRHSEKK